MKIVSYIDKLPGRYLRKIVNYLLTSIFILANSIYFLSLTVVVLRERIDLIHVNNGMNNFAPILVALLLKRKFVVHFHGLENPGRLHRMIIDKVPKFIMISDYLKDIMVSNNVPEDQMVVLHNPTKPKQVQADKIGSIYHEYKIEKDELLFGIIGRIIRWKGHVEFLKSASLVLEAVPQSKAVIIGDMSDGNLAYEQEIRKIVDDSGLKERIIFTGYIPDVSPFYKILDVCVHCSIEPEPFGLVITEAMSHGVAVVASNLGAPQEIITDGQNGYIIDPTATDKLAKTIIDLLSDKELRERIGTNGKKLVESKYQLATYGRDMGKLYMEVLGEL